MLSTHTVGLAALAFLSTLAGQAAPAVPQEDLAKVARGNTAFALDLYGKLRSAEGNLFCSPYSVSTALAMTYAGARGATEAEMAKALHFDLPQDRLHPAMGALIADLNGRQVQNWDGKDTHKPFDLVVANSLWGQAGYPFEKAFLGTTRDAYGAGLTEADFRTAPEKARRDINAWVERKTADKIKDLLAPDQLSPLTTLVLVNAIYFKSAWAQPFPEWATREEAFHVAVGKDVTARMMHRTGGFRTLDTEELRAVELPYEGNELSMLVLLPAKADGLAALEKSLTPDALAGWLGKLAPAQLALGIPKFKTTSSFRLNEPLQALGMASAFSETKADFSGMAAAKGLHIGLVVHKAFVDVNEKGTEAAAATAVVVPHPSAPPKPKDFVVDRPFLFLIRDSKTGSVLFMGRIEDPTK